MSRPRPPVGRFAVMSMLQAARAYVLGLPLESAYSWGLNRAIFVAAAKRGFKGGSGTKAPQSEKKRTSESPDTYFLGDDMAYKTERGGLLLFTFGGEVQTKERFERQVKSRFGKTFPAAWKESLARVKEFDRQTLLSAESFYREVYKPVRDDLAQKWSDAAASSDK